MEEQTENSKFKRTVLPYGKCHSQLWGPSMNKHHLQSYTQCNLRYNIQTSANFKISRPKIMPLETLMYQHTHHSHKEKRFSTNYCTSYHKNLQIFLINFRLPMSEFNIIHKHNNLYRVCFRPFIATNIYHPN